MNGQRVSTTAAAKAVREAASKIDAPGATLHYGGAPFIAEAAATGSQDDLLRLAPG